MSKDLVGHILHEIFGHERAVGAMGAAFAHSGQQTQPLDDFRAVISALAKAKLVELGYELLPHPPYSPDPCDFCLFSNLKKSLAGQKFASNEEVVAATEAYFADLEKTYFSDGLKKLEHRWVKCIELKEDYVEK